MSFLTEIKNFIKTEVLGIEESGTAAAPAKNKETKPVIECKTDAPEDTFERKTEKQDTAVQTNTVSRKAIEETIVNIPTKIVDLRKMIKNGLLEKVAGCTEEHFNRLPAIQKRLVIDSIQISVKRFEELYAAGKINKDANIESLILRKASEMYSAITTGTFNNIQEYEEAAGDINKDLGKDFDKKSKEERRTKFKRRKEEYQRIFNEKIEKIKNLPEPQRSIELYKLMRRHRYIMRAQHLDVAAQRETETAVDATIMLDAEDIEQGAETVIETRNSDKERTEAADYADYEFTKEVIAANAEAGKEVKAEDLEGYTEAYMEYKSPDAAYEYQSAYTEDRNIFEAALRKQQNGEALTPEEEFLINYMSAEYYTATARGIGLGALNNINMNAAEKAEFLAAWENDAKKFRDYEVVTADVKETISENPEYKEIKENFEEIQTEKAEAEQGTSEKKQEEVSGPINSNPDISISDYTPVYTAPAIIEVKTNPTANNPKDAEEAEKPRKQQETAVPQETKSNPIEIAKNIKKDGVEQAVKKYGSDAIRIILDYSGFKHLRPQLTTIIRSYNLNELKEITQHCSDSAFVYICSIVNEDFVEQLRENRERTKGLCYTAANQIKQLEGEYAAV